MLKSSPLHRFLMASAICRAVVEKYGSGAKDPAATSAQSHLYAEGECKCINSQIAIASGDSIASKYHVGKIPTNAILDPRGYFDYDAVTGVSSADIGLFYPEGGAVISVNGLVAADDWSSAGTQTLRGHGTLTNANSNKRVWELAGLASDPGGQLDIVVTINAAATAAGKVTFTFPYSK